MERTTPARAGSGVGLAIPWRGVVGRSGRVIVGLAPVIAALALWAAGLQAVRLGHMNDAGLISVLPASVFAAVAILIVSAGYQLQRERLEVWTLGLHLIALVIALYAIPSVVEDAARTSTVWTHLGFVEYITRTGTTAPYLDARMNWPGFFIAAAFISSIAGQATVILMASWASLFFNLAYLLPLALIVRGGTRDERLMWASLFFFSLTNWVGQDYFAPQALAYLLYLAIVAVVVLWFLVPHPRSPALAESLGSWKGGRFIGGVYALLSPDNPTDPGSLTGRQRVAAVSAVVVLFAFVSFSHQLTPFVTVSSLAALLLFNRISLRAIPILFGVMAVAWVSYMTVPFLAGHFQSLIKEVGSLTATVDANVTSRIAGSPEHQLVVTVRLVFTLAVAGLAALGALLRFRDGRRDLTLILLLVAPLPLAALQGYGGELFLRLYFFGLPIAAMFAAAIVYGRQRRPSVPASLVAIAAALLLASGLLLTRYGNERFDLMTSTEVAAVNELYRVAPAGSTIVSASYNLPFKSAKVEQYQYVSPAGSKLELDDFLALMRDPSMKDPFLILTSSQGAQREVFDGLPVGSWDRFLAEVNASPALRQIYRNADSEILVLADRSNAVAP